MHAGTSSRPTARQCSCTACANTRTPACVCTHTHTRTRRYQLAPDGSTVFLYRLRKTRVDELPPPTDPNANGGVDFDGALSLEGIDKLARELLKVGPCF